MNDTSSDLLDVCVVVYLNDILIYFDNMFQHQKHIKEVVHWLCKAGLYTKAEKCEFHPDFVEYLGYILFLSRLTMFSNKNQYDLQLLRHSYSADPAEMKEYLLKLWSTVLESIQYP